MARIPWLLKKSLDSDPAKKNQRIGRIDRIGQKKQTLHVFNLLSHNSIEMKIATGLLLKQHLFEGVLNASSSTDEVDFSEKGKSQFIRQLEDIFTEDTFMASEPGDQYEMEDREEEELQEMVITDIQSHPMDINGSVGQGNKPENGTSVATDSKGGSDHKEPVDFDQMETVMTKGMEFLTGIYKMSTGNDLGAHGKPKINVNKQTGEVSITFKLGNH